MAETEEKHTDVNYCHEEDTDAWSDAVQAAVANKQDNRNNIGVKWFIRYLLRNFFWEP